MQTQVFTIRLSDSIRKELDSISKDENIPASQIVRQAIDRYVAIRRFRNLRNKTLPIAEAQGLITDEDLLGSNQ